VCGFEPIDELDVLDLVDQLADKSMVVVERSETATRYRLLETLRQFAEEQLEVRDATATLRDRHTVHYAAVSIELARLVVSAREVEGSRAIDAEWDNLRAAHLWALALHDLDPAESIVRSTFYHAGSRMSAEHKEWTRRTVELGIELGRPSAEMIGFHAFWLSIDGRDEQMIGWARRGIAAAPTPDHPTTAQCWSMLAGASRLCPPGSAEVREAFECERRAVANIDNLDQHWWDLVDLVDAAMNADPPEAVALRRQQREIAARVPAPALVVYCALSDGHALLDGMDMQSADFATAQAHYERALDVARDTSHLMFETQALRAIALTAAGLGAPDALDRCHDALDPLYELRYWQKLWQAMDSTTLALATSEHLENAAVLLGHLDAHVAGAGMETTLGFRDHARAFIDAGGGHSDACERGARMSADEVVLAAIGFCSQVNT
jgi:hypothetical protein